MDKLSNVQSQLLQAIFSDSPASNEITKSFNKKGLEIYRNNLRATAINALQITFPTVDALIGKDLMSYAAKELLRSDPPYQGDWAVWGATLADVLEQLPALDNYPFVPDCARLDYICHQLVREIDHTFDNQSLELLQAHDPYSIRLQLAPSLTLLTSNYPVSEIRSAHKLPETERRNYLSKISIKQDENHYISCHRNGYEVQVNSISELEYQWIKLVELHSLGKALDLIDTETFSFEQWLISGIQNNLINRFTMVQ